MRAVLDAFWAPKKGSAADEYEDAFSPASDGVIEGAHLRFAVADGATEAAFSKLWAHLLVEGYRKGWITARAHDTRDGLQRLGEIWRRNVAHKPLPWYGEEKRRQGSYAALLGLEINEPEGEGPGTWRSYAVGDCCLFHLRGDHLLGSFPIEDPEDFGSRPVLLSSSMAKNVSALASAATAWGDWAPGDVFYLVSDALACWLLKRQVAGDPQWGPARELGAGEAGDDFAPWIARLREEHGLRNDDVTLLRIAVE